MELLLGRFHVCTKPASMTFWLPSGSQFFMGTIYNGGGAWSRLTYAASEYSPIGVRAGIRTPLACRLINPAIDANLHTDHNGGRQHRGL